MSIIVLPIRREPILKIMQDLAPQPALDAAGNKSYATSFQGFESALAESWDRISELINRSLRDGWASVRDDVARVTAIIKDRAKELGQRAGELIDRVLDKIREAITRTIDMMLRNLRATITVGEREFSLESVEIENKFSMSSELGVSLESLCKLVSEGEITVKGSYRAG